MLQIDSIPLTANGKVDRHRIAQQIVAHLTQSSRAEDSAQTLQGEAEQLLEQLWCELLSVLQVTASYNFFSLGGDSLLATRVMNRLQQAGYRGALASLFTTPRLRAFAANLQRKAKAETQSLQHDSAIRYQPFLLTEVQQAYWLGRQADFTLGGIAAQCYNEYEMPGMDVARMELAWHQLVLRHDMLRCRITADGQQQIQQQVPYYYFRLLLPPASAAKVQNPQAELEQLRRQMAYQKLDPESGRLYDLQVIRYGDNQVRMAVLFDNLIVDGLSMLTLFTELFHFYQHPDQPLPTRVAPESLNKPRFCRLQAQITPSVLLLTCFSEVLSRWSGQSSLLVNMALFDRKPLHADINKVTGVFTSLILAEYHARAAESWLSKPAVKHARCRWYLPVCWGSLMHWQKPHSGLVSHCRKPRRCGWIIR
ncbi:condensation domain-containing protein [Serratia symbiotica]|uniref:condensation domain-containing protein n=1 Tax=Serratia symbiotica TaxID=138074 RepID=UPI001D908A0E|nr:condensation domain-containing protein [Serratia symbiotica]NIG88038.1 hypothetical protein [Serratia symbiotica]USS96507.1 condensation domain-containing protein [Serratia symbiotica]